MTNDHYQMTALGSNTLAGDFLVIFLIISGISFSGVYFGSIPFIGSKNKNVLYHMFAEKNPRANMCSDGNNRVCSTLKVSHQRR